MFWEAADLALLSGTAAADKLAAGAGMDLKICTLDLPYQVRSALAHPCPTWPGFACFDNRENRHA